MMSRVSSEVLDPIVPGFMEKSQPERDMETPHPIFLMNLYFFLSRLQGKQSPPSSPTPSTVSTLPAS